MKMSFASLDRQVVRTCDFDQPDRYRDLLRPPSGPLIARGSGVSYVAASFSDKAISIGTGRFDRVLGLDAEEGWIEVEAGVTLGRLFELLTPKGLHLAVQPGHPQITVGGCIAGNVHGKNQYREGTFRSLVQGLRLLHPDHGIIEASPENNAEVFELTCGGLGLTGIILSARLRVTPLPGLAVEVENLPVSSLAHAFRVVDEMKAERDMIYAWLDLADLGPNMGRGYVVAGRFVDAPDSSVGGGPRPYKPLDPSDGRLRPLVFRDALMPWVNRVYRYRETHPVGIRTLPLFDFLFPAVGKEFYFDFFGKAGFIEQQILIPAESIDRYVKEVQELIRRHGQPIALATVKAFGGSRRLLHYDGAGFSFTLDVRASERASRLFADLDRLNTECGAITNVLKDSRLSAVVVEQQYPGLGPFKERLSAFDPARRFTSELSERLGL